MLISSVCTSKQLLQLRKMTDSLNFGPEWIRNLSSDGNTSSNTSSGGTKYQLADFRYGREEMLALFEKGLRAPDPLSNFAALYVEQSQLPLALIPMTEDENRLWQSRPAPPISTRGRGGSLERGRGRGRGATFHQGYSRSSSGYDDPVRPYERSQSGWAERNGVADGPEWVGVGSSPRKELGSSRSIGGSDNWRRHRPDEETDGWRTSNHRSADKWSRSSSWREGDPGEDRFERTIIPDRSSRTSWHSSGDASHLGRGGTLRRTPWENSSEDHLPEWATENLHESGGSGSFDSSGAFHGNSTEDENNGTRLVQKSASQQNLPQSNRASTIHTSQSAHSLSNKSDSGPSPLRDDTKSPIKNHNQSNTDHDKLSVNSQQSQNKQHSSPHSKEKEKSPPKNVENSSNNVPQKTSLDQTKTISNNNNIMTSKSNSTDKTSEKTSSITDSSKNNNDKLLDNVSDNQQKPGIQTLGSNGLGNSNNKKIMENANSVKKNEDEFDRMQEVADDLVAKLMLDEETPNSSNKSTNDYSNSINSTSSSDIKSQSAYGSHLQSNLLQNSVMNSNILSQSLPQGPPPPPQTSIIPDKWYYRDPQGDVQGPFLASDMTEWYRAGYFSVNLLLKRQCDERFFTLGELIKLCGNSGGGPFSSTGRLQPIKAIPDPQTLLGANKSQTPGVGGIDSEALQRIQQLQLQQTFAQQQMLVRQAMTLQALSQTEPWAALSQLQQRELIAQHLMTQQPSPANKLPQQMNETKPANNIPNQPKLDPIQQLIQQMGGMQQPHSAMVVPPPGSQISTSLPMSGGGVDHLNQQHTENDSIKNFLRHFSNQQQQQQQQPPSQPPHPSPQQTIDSFWSQGTFPTPNQQPPSWLTNPSPTPNNVTTPVSMWGSDIRANIPSPLRPGSIPTPQHQMQPDNISSMVNVSKIEEQQRQTQQALKQQDLENQKRIEEELKKLKKQEMENEKRRNELELQKTEEEKSKDDLKKGNEKKKADTKCSDESKKEKEKKAAEDKSKKQASDKKVAEEKKRNEEVKKQENVKKLAEEKRKDELKKQETEKKAAEEKRKKAEAEKLRAKAVEVAKREAEEKRLRELEEKRKLKEQRKAEEEAKKKQEEDKKKMQDEKKKEQERKAQEEQARRQAEALRKMQETQQQQRARVAPWCQTGVPGSGISGAPGTGTKILTLAEIQKAEKERRAAELAMQLQQAKAQAQREAQEQQAVAEKSSMQLKWASKVAGTPKKVKSLAEIQAEEQERLAKQAAEARLAQLKEKKETATTPVQSVGIWGSASQSLTWGQNTGAGFWDDSSSVQQQTKVPSSKPTPGVTKSRSAISINQNSNKTTTTAQNKLNNNNLTKQKSAKKDENTSSSTLKLFDANGMELGNEFSSWCTKALTTINGQVHIPTFIGFLMDIESPYEVKDYVRTYLGDSNAVNEFARQFLERRSKAKQRNRAALQHTDDMCVPAPAVNPSNNTEFQEVKGKSKKVKKSRMMKVDSRILGFSVTAAQDRINVGDRDYGDNA
ncbi:GRB10-interacting GYF protein 2 isoform X2 [Chrysoperla carnea]|uniref:GRB10-interacting GYF protein 2 isoform X2 n=1 Tax=Chrysoperla carnea TaxID=189513 RepID=UPI001D06BC90|nr:GRB10-interacting GYF protein 2 isoform X2 [Chrysoperla carnea]